MRGIKTRGCNLLCLGLGWIVKIRIGKTKPVKNKK